MREGVSLSAVFDTGTHESPQSDFGQTANGLAPPGFHQQHCLTECALLLSGDLFGIVVEGPWPVLVGNWIIPALKLVDANTGRQELNCRQLSLLGIVFGVNEWTLTSSPWVPHKCGGASWGKLHTYVPYLTFVGDGRT